MVLRDGTFVPPVRVGGLKIVVVVFPGKPIGPNLTVLFAAMVLLLSLVS